MPINQYNQLGRSSNTPLSAYQYRNAEYQGTGFGQASPQNNYGQFNPNSTYNQSFEMQSGGYGNNMQQYNSGGYDMNLGDSYNQTFNQPNQGSGISNSGYAGIAAGANLATGFIEGSDDNPYNSMYGYQGTSAAGQSAASLGGAPAQTGATLLSTIGSGLDQAMNLQEFDKYGVNTADEGKAEIYQAGVAGLDQMGQLTKDVEQGDWWGVLADSAGLSQLTGMQDYEDEQDAANARREQGQKLERQQKRAMREQTAQLDYQPTMMYANGGAVGGNSGRSTVGAYTRINNDWMRDTTMQGGDLQRYQNPTYVQYNNTTGDTIGGYDVLGQTSFSSDSTAGPQATFYRDYKDKSTGSNYQVPVFDSEVYSKYFPEAKFANGGRSGSGYNVELNNGRANAELETKEIFRTPDGSIEKVPEGTPSHNKGGVKMTLPEGTEILGKMKGKYNDKSYKEMGQDLIKRYNKYNKASTDSISTLSRRTSERMLDKVQKEFDDLWLDQEVQKQYNSRYETKTDIEGNLIGPIDADYSDPQYAKGGKIKKYQTGGPTYNEGTIESTWAHMRNMSEADRTLMKKFYNENYKNYSDIVGDNSGYQWGELTDNFDSIYSDDDSLYNFHSPSIMTKGALDRYTAKSIEQGIPSLYDSAGAFNKVSLNKQFRDDFNNWKKSRSTGPIKQITNDPVEQAVVESQQPITNPSPYRGGLIPETSVTSTAINQPVATTKTPTTNAEVVQGGRDRRLTGDISGTLGTAAQFAPAAYNMYQGMFGDVDRLNASDYRNPYRNRIMGNLEDRKYNINPQLERNELAYQTARRNMRQVAPSTGNLMTNYTALAGSRMRADGQAWAQKQNMENQWRGQNAGIMAQMGSQDARSRLMVDQYNQGSEAAKRSHLSTGLEQLGQSAYNWQSSRNAQRNQDRYYETMNSSMKNIMYDPYTGQLLPKYG